MSFTPTISEPTMYAAASLFSGGGVGPAVRRHEQHVPSSMEESSQSIEARIQELCATKMCLYTCLGKLSLPKPRSLTKEETDLVKSRCPRISCISAQNIAESIQTISEEESSLRHILEGVVPKNLDLSPDVWGHIISFVEPPSGKRNIASLNKNTRKAALRDFKDERVSEMLCLYEEIEKFIIEFQEKSRNGGKAFQVCAQFLTELVKIQKMFQTTMYQAPTVLIAQECIDRAKFQLAECFSKVRELSEYLCQSGAVLSLRDLRTTFPAFFQVQGRSTFLLEDVFCIEQVIFLRNQLIVAEASKNERSIYEMGLSEKVGQLCDRVRSFSVVQRFLEDLQTVLSKEKVSVIISRMNQYERGGEKEGRKQIAEYCLRAFQESGPLEAYIRTYCSLEEELGYLETLSRLNDLPGLSEETAVASNRILRKIAYNCLETHRFSDLLHSLSLSARFIERLSKSSMLHSQNLTWNEFWKKLFGDITRREDDSTLTRLLAISSDIGILCNRRSYDVSSDLTSALAHIVLKKNDVPSAVRYAQKMSLVNESQQTQFQNALFEHIFFGGKPPGTFDVDLLNQLIAALRACPDNQFKSIYIQVLIEKWLVQSYERTKDVTQLELIFRVFAAMPFGHMKVAVCQTLLKMISKYLSDRVECTDHFERYMTAVSSIFSFIRTWPVDTLEKGFGIIGIVYHMFQSTKKPELWGLVLQGADAIPPPTTGRELTLTLLEIAFPYAMNWEEATEHFGRYVTTCDRLVSKMNKLLIPDEQALELRGQFVKLYECMKTTLSRQILPQGVDETFQSQLGLLQNLIASV